MKPKSRKKRAVKKMDYDGVAEARMYRYHRLLLEAKTEVQARLWFAEFVHAKKSFDSSFK